MPTYSLAQATSHKSSFILSSIAKLEKFRIETHLKRVELLLRQKAVDHLSFDLQNKRKANLDNLHRYWKAGVFPNNNLFKERTPFFVDRFGTPCAMAYLINESGYRNLVTSVARDNNFVYINDIKDGPVIDWINQSGLTQAEAAQIQPTYDFMYGCDSDSLSYSGDAICNPTLFNVLYYYLPTLIVICISCLTTWCLYKLASWTDHEVKLKRYSSKIVFNGLFLLFWSLFSFTIIQSTGVNIAVGDALVDYINLALFYLLIIIGSGCLATSLILIPKTMWQSNSKWKKYYASTSYFCISIVICLPLLWILTNALH